MSTTTQAGAGPVSDGTKTPGQIARDAFYDGRTYLLWDELAPASVDDWERAGAAVAALAPPAVVPEELRRLESSDEAVFACACAQWVRTLLSTPSRRTDTPPAGEAAEGGDEPAVLRATVTVYADRSETRLQFGDRIRFEPGSDAVLRAIAALRAEYDGRWGCPASRVTSTPPAGGWAVPDGWRLVPKSLTFEMVAAFSRHFDKVYPQVLSAALQSLLAAAPAAPEPAATDQALRDLARKIGEAADDPFADWQVDRVVLVLRAAFVSAPEPAAGGGRDLSDWLEARIEAAHKDSEAHPEGGGNRSFYYGQAIAYENALSAAEARSLSAPSEAQDAGERLSQAARDVLAERRRQVEAEGWTPEHDDRHLDGTIALASAAYVYGSQFPEDLRKAGGRPAWWPWDMRWWKPTDRRRDLVKGLALGLAEIERLDRASPPTNRADTGAEGGR